MPKNQNFKGQVCPHCQVRFLPKVYDDHVKYCQRQTKEINDSNQRFRQVTSSGAKWRQPSELVTSEEIVNLGSYSPRGASIFRYHLRKPSVELFAPWMGGEAQELASALSYQEEIKDPRLEAIQDDVKRFSKDPTLTRDQKRLLRYHFIQGKSCQEIGTIFGIKRQSVEDRVEVLIKKLRQIIEREKNSRRKLLKLKILTSL